LALWLLNNSIIIIIIIIIIISGSGGGGGGGSSSSSSRSSSSSSWSSSRKCIKKLGDMFSSQFLNKLFVLYSSVLLLMSPVKLSIYSGTN